jgi:hypothetical protein
MERSHNPICNEVLLSNSVASTIYSNQPCCILSNDILYTAHTLRLGDIRPLNLADPPENSL